MLENRDLSAAAQDTKGAYDQAQASYETTTGASLPEEIQKAEADAQQAQQALDAQEKVFQSRQQLFEQGALAAKGTGSVPSRFYASEATSMPSPRSISMLCWRLARHRNSRPRPATGIGQRQVHGSRRRNSAIPKFAAQSTA